MKPEALPQPRERCAYDLERVAAIIAALEPRLKDLTDRERLRVRSENHESRAKRRVRSMTDAA